MTPPPPFRDRARRLVLRATAQTGIFGGGTSSHCFLEFTRRPRSAPGALVRALADLEAPSQGS